MKNRSYEMSDGLKAFFNDIDPMLLKKEIQSVNIYRNPTIKEKFNRWFFNTEYDEKDFIIASVPGNVQILPVSLTIPDNLIDEVADIFINHIKLPFIHVGDKKIILQGIVIDTINGNNVSMCIDNFLIIESIGG